jgi:hypothetical protein
MLYACEANDMASLQVHLEVVRARRKMRLSLWGSRTFVGSDDQDLLAGALKSACRGGHAAAVAALLAEGSQPCIDLIQHVCERDSMDVLALLILRVAMPMLVAWFPVTCQMKHARAALLLLDADGVGSLRTEPCLTAAYENGLASVVDVLLAPEFATEVVRSVLPLVRNVGLARRILGLPVPGPLGSDILDLACKLNNAAVAELLVQDERFLLSSKLVQDTLISHQTLLGRSTVPADRALPTRLGLMQLTPPTPPPSPPQPAKPVPPLPVSDTRIIDAVLNCPRLPYSLDALLVACDVMNVPVLDRLVADPAFQPSELVLEYACARGLGNVVRAALASRAVPVSKTMMEIAGKFGEPGVIAALLRARNKSHGMRCSPSLSFPMACDT